MIAALARASTAFERRDWLELAVEAFHFVSESMADGARLGHSWREERLLVPGLASDLANMIRAAIALFEAGAGDNYLERARGWAEAIEADYGDVEGGGYFLSARDAAALITRPRSTLDDAVPNANGVMADNLFRLAALTGEDRWLRRGDELLKALSPSMKANVFGHASLLNALDFRLHGLEIVVVGSGREAEALAAAVHRLPYTHRTLLRVGSVAELPPTHPVRQAGPLDDNAAFLCSGGRCSLPMKDVAGLTEAMRQMQM
jgi:uncharacterized protein YyaL (SSP411 family)